MRSMSSIAMPIVACSARRSENVIVATADDGDEQARDGGGGEKGSPPGVAANRMFPPELSASFAPRKQT